MSKETIEKGRHVLQMRMKSGKHRENPDLDLMKVPLEALHSLALQQIGEQESYIEELEAQLKDKSEQPPLTHKDHVRIAEEVRREKVIADIWKRFEESQRKNGTLRRKYNELCTKYSYCLTQMAALQEQLKQYENYNKQ